MPELSEELLQLVKDWPVAGKFEVPAGATIVVVGAYKGKAMELMANLFPNYARIIGFEPQYWAWQEAVERMRDYHPQVHISNTGLGAETRLGVLMGEWHTDACSFVNTGPDAREHGAGDIAEANQELAWLGLDKIDLMIMNIEGGEYELLPHLRDTGWLAKVDRLAVQWHLDLPVSDMNNEIAKLSVDYDLVHDERPTWTYHVKESA